jgi:uncharacterized protein (TIGR03435 family)
MKALPRMFCLCALTAGAQPLKFEVASVKNADPASRAGVAGGCHGIDSKYSPNETASAPPLGRCVITDGRLGHMINIAWDLRSMLLIRGGPDWVLGGFDRFSLEAKAEDPAKATEAQLLEMLQNLLVERFKLKFHLETAERAGFALVVGKNGPKLGSAKGQDVTLDFGEQGKPGRGGPVNLTLRKYSMAALANLLSQVGAGPVVDKTNLTGEYDLTLAWDEANGPALTTAVQEQLGLRLEPMKVPVSTFVIDSAAKPEVD